ncbi:crotonase/enoyl-CoA hydratase family protein [Noviherbaspirillum galbum]|uniref:Crotonase/enoyl-CoA hydratase family protein n=1 Tax=Noviherbaspirillum galbum TaxID=2709383 RepID=A0A6B3SYF6_9BURK|nr:crotonase/enoyl-CoA hydratase family protein [Noviherbaspirillum galbum]NEX63732.1 crotonase/enoyl-CoA hydratase family protein [Noviherbaspirillum galbum]
MADEILARAEGAVLILTLNRPEARNAVNGALAHALAEALARYDADPALRMAVLTGAGGSFCAGMDLKAFARGEHPWVPGAGFAGIAERPPTKPIIAAVEGYAVAGGFEIALSCDLIVAADNARFALPEVKRGLVAAAGGLLRLPRRLPYHLAMELALTGDTIDAPRAASLGLVNRIAAPGDALATALRLATAIAENAPLAVAASKRLIAESVSWPVETMFRQQAAIADPVVKSEDAQEGARAFAEKRPAVWRGR